MKDTPFIIFHVSSVSQAPPHILTIAGCTMSLELSDPLTDFLPCASFREGRSHISCSLDLESISLLLAKNFETSLRVLVVITQTPVSHQISAQSLYNRDLNYICIFFLSWHNNISSHFLFISGKGSFS